MKIINLTYSQLMALVTSKSAHLQYIEESDRYQLFIVELGAMWETIILKGSADATNFETNYKSSANANITPSVSLQVADTDVSESNPIPISTNPRPGKFFSKHLTNGGSYDLNVDGSVTPVNFTLSPPIGKKFIIARMIIVMEDSAMSHSRFGGIVGGITNGLLIKVTEGGVERDLSEHIIKINSEFFHLAYDVQIQSAVTDILSVRWSFYKSGTHLELQNTTSDNIKIVVQDDLTSLTNFEILCQGYEVNE